VATSILPFLIQQEIAAGNQFTGESPVAGPEIDGVIFKYPDRNVGGLFKFTERRFMRVRRILADFKDAHTWKIEIQHIDVVPTLTIIAEGQSQVLTFEVTGGTDGSYTITVDGVNYIHAAVSQTAAQIATALHALLAAAFTSDPNLTPSVVDDTVTVVSVLGSTFSSSSTGDPITATQTQASDGEDSLIRIDDVSVDLAPDERVLVTTTGATLALLAEVTAFPSTSLLTTQNGGC